MNWKKNKNKNSPYEIKGITSSNKKEWLDLCRQ